MYALYALLLASAATTAAQLWVTQRNGKSETGCINQLNYDSNSNNFAAERKQPKDIFNRRKYVEAKVIVKSVGTGFELVQFNFLGKTVETATTITIAIRT